ncbi:hypothetical protein ATANTOWER_028795 [Ataeniobius toweri]|uniref:Uncharacterized protein n=1 Tax=Ataeniobius toweri TaxID=208326 RepID=A0ABU7C481_9TELE|nr:hypothetical protein [Ataeniobius toweri]
MPPVLPVPESNRCNMLSTHQEELKEAGQSALQCLSVLPMWLFPSPGSVPNPAHPPTNVTGTIKAHSSSSIGNQAAAPNLPLQALNISVLKLDSSPLPSDDSSSGSRSITRTFNKFV